MIHLTNSYNIKNAGFEISQHISEQKIESCINEAEKIHVKERISDPLYIDLLKWIEASDKSEFPTLYEVLMNGGEFTTDCGELHQFDGLINAVNYYSYSRLIRHSDENTTRFGFMQKTDEYSTHADFKVKQAAYDDILHTADIFMNDVIFFLNANKKMIPEFKKAGIAKNRLSIKILK
jgi:hypothetical protein